MNKHRKYSPLSPQLEKCQGNIKAEAHFKAWVRFEGQGWGSVRRLHLRSVCLFWVKAVGECRVPGECTGVRVRVNIQRWMNKGAT
ncbi:hypothetical protein E2C01_039872 [Portunus trituberculatus]|uniref:Uncharacterized protein n=1 Tax=Portunus trituberculatus TaxID=210409 RepID=A0A5B7FM31_PORTR|nr:hypothetical protein [Portunus trituberculatus]